MATTYESIMSGLESKKYKAVYFLAGEEPYYIDLISDYIEQNVLDEAEKAFNQIVVYGNDTNIYNIIEQARRFPMMASHQVIIVKEAQGLDKIDELTKYLDNPLESTILAICYKYKALDKRLSLYKKLEKLDCYFESKKLRDYQVPDWIENFLSSKKIASTPEAREMLTSFLGEDLQKIANELEKLIITLPKDKRAITPDIIEKNIGISKAYNNFELQKAIGNRDNYNANAIIKYFSENPKSNPIQVTMSVLYGFFSKLLIYHSLKPNERDKATVASKLKINPYFVNDYSIAARNYPLGKTIEIISILRTYDTKSKGVNDGGTDSGELLKEMAFMIMH